jgi:hypothetical protein
LVALLTDSGRRALHGNSASGAAGVACGFRRRASGFTDGVIDIAFDGSLRGARALSGSKLVQDVVVDGIRNCVNNENAAVRELWLVAWTNSPETLRGSRTGGRNTRKQIAENAR